MNTIKDFATSFPSITLHGVHLLLWKKIHSLTLFKIITIIRPSTLLCVFFVGDQDLQLREGLGKALPTHDQNFVPHRFVGCHFPPKNWVFFLSFMLYPVPLLITDYTLENNIFDSFKTNFNNKFSLWCTFSIS